MATGGLGVGIVTKRGTNAFHGNAQRLLHARRPAVVEHPGRAAWATRACRATTRPTTREQITDMTFDLGGPILKDKLWFYGSYGATTSGSATSASSSTRRLLKAYSAKLNWQATGSDMVSVFWFQGGKIKTGRAGSAPGALSYLEGTLWDQGKEWPGQPHGLSKVEWNHVFGPSFFLTAKAARYNTGFSLAPQGGLEDSHWVWDNVRPGGARHGLRPVLPAPAGHAGNLDGSYFANGLGGNHELKFGLGYRGSRQLQRAHEPRQQGAGHLQHRPRRAPASTATRPTPPRTSYLSAHLGDTFTRDRFTVNLGVRWDNQTGRKGAVHHPGQPAPPEPAAGARLRGRRATRRSSGATSRRASASPTRSTSRARPCCAARSRATRASCRWATPPGTTRSRRRTWSTTGRPQRRRDRPAARGRLQSNVRGPSNIDLTNPGGIGESPNQIDPDYHANIDNEVVVGLDRELAPNVALSVAYTWRKSTDLTVDPAPVRHLLVQLDRRRPLRLPPGAAVLPERLLRDAASCCPPRRPTA